MAPVAAGTRERLLDAALALLGEGGYASASVLAIADRAGVSAGALYRHWPSKGELFAELFRRVCDHELAAMDVVAAELADATGVERIEAVLATFAERALRNPRVSWALIAEPLDPLVDAERLAYRREYARRLSDALGAAIAAGEVPGQDVALTSAALVGGVGEALLGPLSPVSPGSPDVEATLASLRAFTRRAVGAG